MNQSQRGEKADGASMFDQPYRLEITLLLSWTREIQLWHCDNGLLTIFECNLNPQHFH